MIIQPSSPSLGTNLSQKIRTLSAHSDKELVGYNMSQFGFVRGLNKQSQKINQEEEAEERFFVIQQIYWFNSRLRKFAT